MGLDKLIKCISFMNAKEKGLKNGFYENSDSMILSIGYQ